MNREETLTEIENLNKDLNRFLLKHMKVISQLEIQPGKTNTKKEAAISSFKTLEKLIQDRIQDLKSKI